MNSDPTQDDRAPRRRIGGRSTRVREMVLAATVQQVLDQGIEGLSLGAVAARAGVSETTIYRRWGTRTALIADAMNELAAVGNPPPDTGILREDLRQILEQITRLITRPGMARLLGTAAALDTDPELSAARTAFWNSRFEQITPVVERACTTGSLRADAPAREILETLTAPLYFRLLVTAEPIDAELITRCIEHTITLYRLPRQ
ncbi:TetR/AcrR family transcriptional regulator [Nocardia sp. NPDC051832]|uniref:TetR/AcrR family transcriptional regulator n=1 Tax=Nocardia sp. NPDC051832 TaxID=3155673 RepID=UPI00341CEF34